MYREFEAEIKAGGYPTPTYRGTKKFGMNVDTEMDEYDIIEAAKYRARKEVARDMSFHISMVEVVSIRYT